MQQHSLDGLRSDTLAHILATLGIASILRGNARVGWSVQTKHPFIESELSLKALDDLLENGITKLKADCKIIQSYEQVTIKSKKNTKSQGVKGRKKADPVEGETESKHVGLSASLISEQLDKQDQSFGDLVISFAAIASRTDDVTEKPRALFARLRPYCIGNKDIMGLEKMKDRLGIIEELVSPERMAQWIGKISGQKGVSGFDHMGHFVNMGIYQSGMTRSKQAHPIVEMLAIEGLKIFPAHPVVGVVPRNRRMSKNSNGDGILWNIPIWEPALDYYAIEDIIADGRSELSTCKGILEMRIFEIVNNSQSWIARPVGVETRHLRYTSQIRPFLSLRSEP